MVAIPNAKGQWMPYDPETRTPQADYSRYHTCPNIYRNHFSRQPNNPYSIAEGKKPLPVDLNAPCIEDVTKTHLHTVSLSLPIDTAATVLLPLVLPPARNSNFHPSYFDFQVARRIFALIKK